MHERAFREITEKDPLFADLFPTPPGEIVVGYPVGVLVDVAKGRKVKFRFHQMFDRGFGIGIRQILPAFPQNPVGGDELTVAPVPFVPHPLLEIRDRPEREIPLQVESHPQRSVPFDVFGRSLEIRRSLPLRDERRGPVVQIAEPRDTVRPPA